jgi:hypothetical protein
MAREKAPGAARKAREWAFNAQCDGVAQARFAGWSMIYINRARRCENVNQQGGRLIYVIRAYARAREGGVALNAIYRVGTPKRMIPRFGSETRAYAAQRANPPRIFAGHELRGTSAI